VTKKKKRKEGNKGTTGSQHQAPRLIVLGFGITIESKPRGGKREKEGGE